MVYNLEAGSVGSPGNICQWSNTHCGKACPPVFDLFSKDEKEIRKMFTTKNVQIHEKTYRKSAVNPNDSLTGK